jgi:hypothetical protein
MGGYASWVALVAAVAYRSGRTTCQRPGVPPSSRVRIIYANTLTAGITLPIWQQVSPCRQAWPQGAAGIWSVDCLEVTEGHWRFIDVEAVLHLRAPWVSSALLENWRFHLAQALRC